MADGTSSGQSLHSGKIATALGADALLLEGFTASERLAEPFNITCQVISLGAVEFTPHLGSGVSLTVDGDALVGRAFHGLLAEASRVDDDAGAVSYRLVLRPWFWFLSLGRNSRIFQNRSTRDIIQDVFDTAGISTTAFEFNLNHCGTVVRDYCVQYDESDFDFVSRMMEEEGIYYHFAHSADKHVMVLCDGKASHGDFGGGALKVNRSSAAAQAHGPHLSRWDEHVRPAPISAVMRDFHVLHFADPMETSSAKKADSHVTGELYHYPGRYSHLSESQSWDASDYVAPRLQAARAERALFSGSGDTFAVACGDLAAIAPVASGHADIAAAEVMLLETRHTFSGQTHTAGARGQESGATVAVSLEAVPADTVWKPLLRTPRPVARGPQVATVVGPKGEVIHVDPYGRVRVQFPWDRQGKNDENSGFWIRVSQGWADKGFGQMHIPRIGEEVIVDFFDGDLDRPVVTGRVYNSTNVVPYSLPGDKTKSTWKSQTVGASGEYPDTVEAPPSTAKGFNEVRFEDKGGAEEVFVHAQRTFTGWYRFDENRTTGHNTTIKVGYDRNITIKHDENKTVEEGDETHTVSKGSLTTTVSQGDEVRKVDVGKRTTTIYSDETLTVTDGKMATTVSKGDQSNTVSQGNQSTTVSQGNQSTTVSIGNITIKAEMGAVSIEAMQKIELKVGTNTVTIDMSGVTIKGLNVESEAQLMHSGKGTMTQLQGSAMTTITGGLVMIN